MGREDEDERGGREPHVGGERRRRDGARRGGGGKEGRPGGEEGRPDGGREGRRAAVSIGDEGDEGPRHLAKFGDVFARTGHYSGPILAVAQGCGPAPCV